jgi:hypothetical protein
LGDFETKASFCRSNFGLELKKDSGNEKDVDFGEHAGCNKPAGPDEKDAGK